MNYIIAAALAILGSMMVIMVLREGFKSIDRRKAGVGFALIAAGFLHSMATKPSGPSIEWDDYLANDGSCFTTNGVTLTGVKFAWSKTRSDLPNSQPLYISKCPTNGQEFVLAATTTVGGSPYPLTLANPDTYRYLVWHEWLPPSPVHTNGVWLGNIIEKAKDTDGIDKLIIINGELRQNGKVIAP